MQEDICKCVAGPSVIESLTLPCNPGLADTLLSVSNPDKLISLEIRSFDEDAHLSKAVEGINLLIESNILMNLRSLTLNLIPDIEPGLLFDFLRTLPLLEHLHMFYPPPLIQELNLMQEFILSAPNLLHVHLATSFSTPTDLFVNLSLRSDLTALCIYIISRDGRLPELPEEAINSILDQNQTATTLVFASSFQVPKVVVDYGLFSKFNKSLNMFHFVSGLSSYLVTRKPSDWNLVNSEAREILVYSRILSAFQAKRTLRLPLEIISQIFIYSVAQNPLWIKGQLDVIFRCLRDRRTLGKIRSEVVEFDKNVLFVKCKRALTRI